MRLACLACVFAFAYGCAHEEPAGPEAGPTFQPPPSELPTREGEGIKIGQEASPIPGTNPVVDDGSLPGFAGNHSFETALWLEPDGQPPIANEHRADQLDYFAFHGKGGVFYTISTEAGAYHPDNVITLYDGERRVIASNDVGSIWPDDAVDARLVVRLPHDGDYFVKVEDMHTTAEVFDADFVLLFYHLAVRTVTAETPGFALWDGSLTLADYLIDPEYGYAYLTVVGAASAPSQEIAFMGLAERALIARVLQGGSDGNGSTVMSGRASVRDASGALLAEVDRAAYDGHIRPPVSEGEHRITLQHDGELGDNAFFAIDLVMLEENPRELHEAQNGVPAGAEQVAFSHGTRGRALLLSLLPSQDVDYYAVPVAAGSYIGVTCEGQTTGSGVRGLIAELRDPGDQRLVASADVGQGLDLSAIVGEAGTYYLRLSAEGAAEALPWVRCALIVG